MPLDSTPSTPRSALTVRESARRARVGAACASSRPFASSIGSLEVSCRSAALRGSRALDGAQKGERLTQTLLGPRLGSLCNVRVCVGPGFGLVYASGGRDEEQAV